MESGLIFHSHSPSFHRWPFSSCSLLTPSLSHPPRLYPLCSTHRRRRQDFDVRDRKPGQNSRGEFPRDGASGSDSLYDGSKRRGGRKRRRPWLDFGKEDELIKDEYPMELTRGILDEFIDSFWFFKLLGSYGWALPIIILSLLISTGPRAFLTAMLIPIGLSFLTFAFRLLRGLTQGTFFEYRPKGEKKSSTKTMETPLTEENEGEMRWTKDPGMHRTYRPSRANGSAVYGGWEDLIDEEVIMGARSGQGLGTRRDDDELETKSGLGFSTRKDDGELGTTKSDEGLGTRKEKTETPIQDELDSRVQVREQPLVFRLLVSLFPFLSSWVDML